MKKLHLHIVLLGLLLGFALAAQAQAKYIFYFIGDGMGFGAVTVTESYLAAKQEGAIGSANLTFSTFPATGFSTTYSASNLVTCSAAGGTAMACGEKTQNGRIGMNTDATAPLKSIAYRLKEKGYKIGIATSVSLDHATPASFYAHQPSRGMSYEIASEIVPSGFDFFAGAGFVKPAPEGKTSIEDQLKGGGYTLVRSLADCKASTSSKTVLIQPEGKSAHSLPYAIDKQPDDYTLAQITQAVINKLDNKKGFFAMIEGGMIDWASHGNDAATMVGETLELSDAVAVAMEYYKKYPKQTLIVVTADHETGGLGLGNSEGAPAPVDRLALQDVSMNKLASEQLKEPLSYAQLLALVQEHLTQPLSFAAESQLRNIYAAHCPETPKRDDKKYTLLNPSGLANKLATLVSLQGGANYSTYSHTGTMVPVYAIGAGSELFVGKMNNTDIPKKIAKAAGVKWE